MLTPSQRADLHARLRDAGVEPCGDSSCIFGPAPGMHTNGGCRCFADEANKPIRLRDYMRRMALVLRGYAASATPSRHDEPGGAR